MKIFLFLFFFHKDELKLTLLTLFLSSIDWVILSNHAALSIGQCDIFHGPVTDHFTFGDNLMY